VASADETLGDPLGFEGDDWWATTGVLRKMRGKGERSIGGGDEELERRGHGDGWRETLMLKCEARRG
jgi:hypothetical protein